MRKKGPFKSAASSALPRLLPLTPSLPPAAAAAPFTLLRRLQGRQLCVVAVPSFHPRRANLWERRRRRRLRRVVARLGESLNTPAGFNSEMCRTILGHPSVSQFNIASATFVTRKPQSNQASPSCGRSGGISLESRIGREGGILSLRRKECTAEKIRSLLEVDEGLSLSLSVCPSQFTSLTQFRLLQL